MSADILDQELRQACYDAEFDEVKRLVDEGANVNSTDEDNSTPLIIAAKHDGRELTEICEYLLDQGAEINSQDSKGWTSLHHSAWGGHDGVVKLLIEKGATVNVDNDFGSTPLILAAKNGYMDDMTCEYLVDGGADMNIQENNGSTALHYAARLGDIRAVKLLVNKGANLYIKDYERGGRTALDWAKASNYPSIIFILEKMMTEAPTKFPSVSPSVTSQPSMSVSPSTTSQPFVSVSPSNVPTRRTIQPPSSTAVKIEESSAFINLVPIYYLIFMSFLLMMRMM